MNRLVAQVGNLLFRRLAVGGATCAPESADCQSATQQTASLRYGSGAEIAALGGPWIRSTRPVHGFTIMELLVVVAILGVLVSLLLPSLTKAKKQAKGAKCSNNLKQVGMGFLLYAGDYADQLPPFNSGGPFRSPTFPHNPTNWWYQLLSTGKYLPDVKVPGGVWRCPAVADEDMQSPFGVAMEGYGPLENTNAVTGLPSIINYAFDHNRSAWGSARLGQIQRTSQLWLIGDVGQPKDLNNIPRGGYRTEICTYPPNALGMWDQPLPKQPACRHELKAGVFFVDGHIELWNFGNLADNKHDLFSLKSR